VSNEAVIWGTTINLKKVRAPHWVGPCALGGSTLYTS
jgi:hypothetical protein